MFRIDVRWIVLPVIFCIPSLVCADGVLVNDLPSGGREIVGASADGSHILQLNAIGQIASWSDVRGNEFLAPVSLIWQVPPTAIEAVDGERVLSPVTGAKIEIKTISAEQIDAIVRTPDGFELTYSMTPTRLGIRLSGRPSTTLRLRYATSVEGCRIHSGDKVAFATAELGVIDGSKQLVVDARRTRAMAIELPDGAAASWKLGPQAYPAQPFFVVADIAMKDGQTIWLSPAPIPTYDGAVDFGFFYQRGFHPSGNPIVITKLSTARFAPDAPVTLTFRKPINEVVKDGVVVAGLVPLSPFDPVEAMLRDLDWLNRSDEITPALLPLKVTQDASSATITAPQQIASGVYRLRVWVVARATPLPEALGGAKGAIAAYFPGFVRGMWQPQDIPIGDAIVAVRRAGGGSISIADPRGRYDFWRGETVHLLVQARAAKASDVAAQITVREVKSNRIVASHQAKLAMTNGIAATELALNTTTLAPGEYRVEAAAADLEPYAYPFTIAPLPRSGMAMVQSPMSVPNGIKSASDRLGANVWTDIITPAGGYLPTWPDAGATSRGLLAGDASLPASALPARTERDELVARNWFWLQGIHSRQLDFYFYHSLPEQTEENLRKHLLYAQFNQRYPSMLGIVMGYDLLGLSAASSWGSGWESFGSAGAKRNAILNEKWAEEWKREQEKGATAADAPRAGALFNAHVIGDFYAQSARDLHDALPRQRQTSSNTADHADINNGLFLPALYSGLDFRYIETWNDQVYPCSAVDFQEMFWTSLLRMERGENQPVWVTVPTAPQSGTYLRRMLQTSSRGATGAGYGSEGGAGASGESAGAAWAVDPSKSNVRTAGTLLSNDVATRYGAFFNAFEPHEEIAILYSISNGGSNFAPNSWIYTMYSVLAQLNRPAKLITEEEIAEGKLKDVTALVLVRQAAALPPKTVAAIERFAASGGKVIADVDTTVEIKCMQKIDELYIPPMMLFVWSNIYHEIVSRIAGIADERAWQTAYVQLEKIVGYFRPERIKPIDKPLLAALGDIGKQPLEPIAGGRAMVSHKIAGDATLVFVTNENIYPFEEMLDDAQLKARFFRCFLGVGSIYYKDVRFPSIVTLRLRDDLAQAPPHIYDVFAGKEIQPARDANGQWTLTLDLATLQGRALLIRPRTFDTPTIAMGSRQDSDPLATLVVRSEVPLPVKIRVGDQEIFRASSVLGSCDTFALPATESGGVKVEVTELVSGQSRRGSIRVTKPAPAALAELPAVQIDDPARVQRLLASKNLAIYVDARQAGQLDAAKKLASRLGAVEVVFNPKIEDFALNWDPSADVEAANQRILAQGVLAQRRPPAGYFDWVGSMKPSMVWNRPAIVFGNATDNRLIADLNSVTLLPRPATSETLGAGRAWVGVAASPFWYKQDVVVALCADSNAELAALESLAKVAVEKRNEPGPSSDDEAVAERRRQLGFEPLKYPAKLVELPTVSSESQKSCVTPCIPVIGLTPTSDGGAIVALQTPGKNLVRIDSGGKEVWRATTAGWYQALDFFAGANGECVSRDNGGTFFADESLAWRHDASGKLRWKMMATPLLAPGADGSTWTIVASKILKRISAAGEIAQTIDLKEDKLLALAPDGRTVFVQRPSKQPNYERVDSNVVAIDVESGKGLWTIEQCEATESVMSEDGKLFACIERENFWHRDDIARSYASRITVIEVASGRVVTRTSVGQWINQLMLSPDGKMVMARLGGYSDGVVLADLASGSIRQLKLPECGGWAHAFSRDGRTLWIACEKLYRIDTASMEVREAALADARILKLVALPNDLLAGTSDGRVLSLNSDGSIHREVNLASGIAVTDIKADLRKLREAKLIDSPSMNPHEIPATINFQFEYPRGWSFPLETRADGCMPPHVAIHVATAGKYRFTIPVTNAKTADASKFGNFRLIADEKIDAVTTPVNGDKWVHSGVLELKPGAYDVRVQPEGWLVPILFAEMKVEKAE